MSIALIAAMNADRVIGSNGTIPWHVSEDLQHFKSLTLNHPVIMGRKTFLSIGRPLAGRKNLVVSSTLKEIKGVEICRTLQEAVAKCHGEEVFIIGGAKLYEEGLLLADTLYITEIEKDCHGDTKFPDFKGLGFVETSRSKRLLSAKEQIYYCFVTYQKKL